MEMLPCDSDEQKTAAYPGVASGGFVDLMICNEKILMI